MSSKITVTFSFVIPKREIAEFTLDDLKEFLVEQLQIDNKTVNNQFRHYELEDFNPNILETRIEKLLTNE